MRADLVASGLLMVAALALFTVSPVLLILGGWAGSDGGSIWRGIAAVLGVPWLGYLVCALGTVFLLRLRRPRGACALAAVPLAALGWVGWRLVA